MNPWSFGVQNTLFIYSLSMGKSFLYYPNMVLHGAQLSDAKIFQTVLFNGMFSKMSKSVQGGRKRKRGSDVSSLFIDRTDLWKPNNAYLILPAVTSNFDTAIPIDWESIQSTSSALKNLAQQEDQDLEFAHHVRRIPF